MAKFQTCFDWAMNFEDRTRAYASVPDPGGFAIAGINSAVFPAYYASINALPQGERGPSVEQFYQENFWNQWLAQLASDEIAKRVFDAGVNMGSGTAAKLLQQAVNAVTEPPGPFVQVDGMLGPGTVAASNALNPGDLVAGFKGARASYYQKIVSADPSKAQYLAGWLSRAGA